MVLGTILKMPAARDVRPESLVEGGHEGLRFAGAAEIGNGDGGAAFFRDLTDVVRGLLRNQENRARDDRGKQEPRRPEACAMSNVFHTYRLNWKVNSTLTSFPLSCGRKRRERRRVQNGALRRTVEIARLHWSARCAAVREQATHPAAS